MEAETTVAEAGGVRIDTGIMLVGLKEEAIERFRVDVSERYGIGREIAVLRSVSGTRDSYLLDAPWSDAAESWYAEDPRIASRWQPTARALRIDAVGIARAELIEALARIYDAVVWLTTGAAGRTLYVGANERRSGATHAPYALLDRPVAFRRNVFDEAVAATVPLPKGAQLILFVGRGDKVKFRNLDALPDVFWTRHPFLHVVVKERTTSRFVLVWNTVAGVVQQRIPSNISSSVTVRFQDAASRLGSPVVLPEDPPEDPWEPPSPKIVLDDLEALVRRTIGRDVTVLDAGLVRYEGRLRRPAFALSPEEAERCVHLASSVRSGRVADRRGSGGHASAAPPTVLVAHEVLSPGVDPRDRAEAVLHEAAHLVGDVAVASSPVRGGPPVRNLRWACACALINLALPIDAKLTGVGLASIEDDVDPDLGWWRKRMGSREAVARVQSVLDAEAARFLTGPPEGGEFSKALEAMVSAMAAGPFAAVDPTDPTS